MTFEDVLQRFLALIGREVLVGISLGDGGGPFVSLLGVLKAGEASPAHEILRQMGRVSSDDESIMFIVEPDNRLTISKRRFRGADESQLPDDGFWIDLAGVLIAVADADKARAIADRL